MEDKLAEFIVKAKKATYASNQKARKLEDGTEEFVFQEGDYKYVDRYKGSKQFSGQENVFLLGILFWRMNYEGRVIDNINKDLIYGFLKKALFKVNKDKPFRGPLKFKENSLEYFNEVEGSIGLFKGKEKILYKGKVVYKLSYDGGRIN
ncbi:MAG: hypothetical protein HYS32_00290 [Candidatus Woesearchaeota archaeon]|nr:MAG: hypothetical protein HYS32_00290 [Candidatus Woesearchaeota archaeon]